MYAAEILDTRVTVLNRTATTDTAYGKKAGTYEEAGTIWASWKWNKGMKAMREGALDAYDTIMVRCRATAPITRDSRLRHEGRDYQIQSLNANKKENEMQIICVSIQD